MYIKERGKVMDRSQALALLKKIVQINSVNPPGNETLVADELKKLFEEHGIETELVEYSEGRCNLIATLNGSSAGKVLGFTGHMDVVPPGQIEWKYDPFGAEEVDGKIYGRGSCDMKSGLMAFVMAMISLKEEDIPLKGSIKLLATIGEETGAIGAGQLTEEGYADDLDALIVGEPSSNEIVTSHKGALWLEIITYGKTAHGSAPHLGVNAVEHMNEIINQIQSDNFKLPYEYDELLKAPTFSINAMQGGSSMNVIPDYCSMKLDIRTLPSQNHEEILENVHKMVELSKDRYPNLNAEIKVVADLEPVKTNIDDPFVDLTLKASESVSGPRDEPKGFTGITDACAFKQSKKDFPIIVMGPGDITLAHQSNEYVEVEEYLNSIETYKEVAKKFLTE